MYWQEKLDIIKKKHRAPIFRDMFREGGAVIEKIMRVFHNATYQSFMMSENPSNLLKKVDEKAEMTILEFEHTFLDILDDSTNYWLLLIDVPMGNSHQVYDCQKEALVDLYYLASSRFNRFRFYIVDKKYKWLYFYDMNREEDIVNIYKSENE